jgi:hypothetical protein
MQIAWEGTSPCRRSTEMVLPETYVSITGRTNWRYASLTSVRLRGRAATHQFRAYCLKRSRALTRDSTAIIAMFACRKNGR